MINFSLDLPPTKKKTRDQKAMEWMIQNARGPSSKGYYDKFKKRILEARKKDDAINKANKRVSALEWIDANIGMYEKDATPKQKEVLKKMQKRLATKPTEENLYNTYIQMLQEGTLKPMSFEDFEKNFSGLDVQVKKSIPPVRTASVWSSIKNSSIYKLLENEKLLGTELGHGALIELIHLAQNSGLMKRGGRVK